MPWWLRNEAKHTDLNIVDTNATDDNVKLYIDPVSDLGLHCMLKAIYLNT